MEREAPWTFLPFTSASSTIPTWYRNLPARLNGERDMRVVKGPRLGTNANLKMCVPFLDAIMSGYTLCLTHDLYVEYVDDKQVVNWKIGGDLVTVHLPEQREGVPIPDIYTDTIFKWSNVWGIETPAGYSSFFTHPINRFDLPFLTLSGVVDTDKYNLSVLFPFLLRKDFVGLIERGTPIAQVIPFKRENWTSEWVPELWDKAKHHWWWSNSTAIGWYKKNIWKKKTYN